MAALVTDHAVRRLLDAGRAVVSDLDLEAVLSRVLSTAAEVTGARYAALGILDEQRGRLERFLTHGLTDEQRLALGDPPTGHGLLGALIADPRALRVDDLAHDPRAVGFPPGHPDMGTFLGVPIMIGGRTWGNLYLCDRLDGEPFTDADEQAVLVLAEWAAVAVENARLFQRSEQRRRELEAMTEIARALGGETDLTRILELIVQRGLGLLGARGLLILLREPDGLTVAASAGEVPSKFDGARLRCGADRVRDALGLAAHDGTVVPLVFRGRTLGMLVALGAERAGDDALLSSFAASAATAVATARTVEEQRLRDAMRAAEAERRHWARELHDTTLQGLGALRMMLTAGSRAHDPDRVRTVLRDAMSRLEEEIAGLRGLVRELRPAALDELGLAAAIEGLAARAADDSGMEVVADVALLRARHDADLETAVYRIVQEATTNATRHADARRVTISLTEDVEALHVRVADDGHGFDPRASVDGFGLAGMRERVTLLHGELEIASSTEGTTVSAAIPNPYFSVTGGAVLPMAGAPVERTVEP